MAMIIQGDARHLPLKDASVQMVCTSPPYWGLRNYAVDGQLGLEATPEAYVADLVQMFQEIWRVLKVDGTVWLNLGDSYANDTKWGGATGGKHVTALHGEQIGRGKRNTGLKSKDLIGIPWRVAFALQAAGWYLRADIIWAKPNPMPESVRDRPTKSHEYMFLLTKRASYYYDADAIKEPYAESTLREIRDGYRGTGTKDYVENGVQNPSDVKSRIIKNIQGNMSERGVTRTTEGLNLKTLAEKCTSGIGRNKRSVWTITPQPYRGAHFATFPEKLVTPCILAGSRPGDLILDPFSGSGTVAKVAEALGRRAVGTDLSLAYCRLGMDRVAGIKPTNINDKQAGHGRKAAGFNERWYGAKGGEVDWP